MATKERKRSPRTPSRTSGRPTNYSQLYKDDHSKLETAPVAKSSTARASRVVGEKKGSETVNWHEEYAYVIQDLRTLAVVSALLFLVMIGAGLIF